MWKPPRPSDALEEAVIQVIAADNTAAAAGHRVLDAVHLSVTIRLL